MYQLRWCLEKRWDRTLPIYLFRDFSFARISRMLRMRPYEQCFATHSPVPRGHWGREAFIPDTPVIKIVAHRAASEFWFEKRIKKKIDSHFSRLTLWVDFHLLNSWNQFAESRKSIVLGANLPFLSQIKEAISAFTHFVISAGTVFCRGTVSGANLWRINKNFSKVF